MATDHFRYDLLVQDALRGMVRRVLGESAREGLPGDHHFLVTFRTDAPGVRLSKRMRDKYPEEMTIVLQHQFWDLAVTEHAFEVGLSFNNIPERLLVPFESITSFVDPSVQFGLKFEVQDLGVEQGANDAEPDLPRVGPRPVADSGRPVEAIGPRPLPKGAARPASARSDSARSEPAKSEPAKSEPAKAARPEERKSETRKAEKGEAVPAESARAAPARSEAAAVEPPAGAEPAKVVSIDAFRKKT